ncbi:MAG: T9SS type A sorting domain-containing protein, partial [Bacteroidota bacterium]|nr:T9SS type A sorting domain-containing protein [Bacteroidota bacterium]
SANLTLTTSFGAREFEVDAGKIITPGANALTIDNLLTLKSDATGTAMIGQATTSNYLTNNVLAERYISNKRAWRLLGIPYSSSLVTIQQTWMESFSNSQPGYGTQITTYSGDPNAANFDGQKPASSIRTYSADNFNSDAAHTPNTTNNIASNQAYFLFVRGDRTVDRTTSGSPTSATTLRTYGFVNMGNVIKGVTGTGFSLIPNPYPSDVDFDKIKAIAANSSISTFYVWDPNLGTVGQYRSIQITGTSPNYTYTATPGSQDNNWRFIETGTAFMIPGNSTMSFTEATKSAGTPPSSMFRTAAGKETELAVNLYSVNGTTTALADGIREVFDNNYAAAIDKDDAKKISGFEMNFGIASNNEVLAIEKRPMPNANDVIALKLWNTAAGNYQFEMQPSNFSSQTLFAYLQDNYLNTKTPIDLNGTTVINFTITSAAASSAENRFSIVFTKSALFNLNTTPSIVVYPNPVQNGMVTLQMNNMPKGIYNVRLVNSFGQTIVSKQINHAEGTSTETFGVNKVKGSYLLEVTKPDNSKSTNKLIIN